MRHRLLRTLLLPFVLLAARGVEGQVVQGTIEDEFGLTVTTALVTLEEESGVTVRAVVSTAEGSYSIPAGRAGRFRIRVERLGLSPYTSPVFELAAGEVHTLPIIVPPAPVVLEEIGVNAEGICEVRPDEAGIIARIRDAAGRILSESPPLDPVTVFPELRAIHYRRELNREGRQLRLESMYEYSLGPFLPFSPRAENLLIWGGFAGIAEEDRRFSFYAPPVGMIFSEPFLQRTCFTRVVQGEGAVGLVFAPMKGMTVVGIGGTVWLDPATLRVNLLEFHYYDPVGDRPNDGGGEIEFLILPDGSSLLTRWAIRMPSRLELPPENVRNGRSVALAISEEGGILLTADGLPVGGGSEVLSALHEAFPDDSEGDILYSTLPRTLVMRTVPSENYVRASRVILATLREVTAFEIDLAYTGVNTVQELLTLRFPTARFACPPLYVVDGVPFSTEEAIHLHPRDIASMQVHRYGAELTLFGAPASCGLVQIQLRR